MPCPGLGTSVAPAPWTVAFNSSSCFSPSILLGVRVVVAAILVIHFAIHFAKSFGRDGFFYFIFLTNWSFIFEVVYVVILVVAQRMAQQQSFDDAALRADSSEGVEQPALIRVTMVLFMITQPLSLIVVIMYWTLEKPIWKICAVNGGVEPCDDWPSYLSVFVHFYDFVLVFGLLLVGKIPYYFSNSLWLILFGLLYVLWTLIHFLLNIGLPETLKCERYPLNECPIYDAFDWHHPDRAVSVLVGAFFGAFLLIGIYRAVVWLRDAGTGSSGTSAAFSSSEESLELSAAA